MWADGRAQAKAKKGRTWSFQESAQLAITQTERK
jgi:hypothetical protein